MFKPSLHGWGFDDAFTVEGPALGLGAAPDRFGLGGGMCWAALDRYLDGRAIPDLASAPAAGSPLHAEILQRQVAALADVWPRLRQWQALPDGSWRDRLPVALTPGRGDATSLTRAAWRPLKRSLAAGKPVLLTLIRHDDGYTRATAARQVLAYDCATDGATVILSVYDPTRPNDDDVRLAFSRRGALDARLTGGERARGFFAVPYDREPAGCVHAESFADRAVINLNRKVRGAVRAAPGRRGLHAVARDGDGALIHFHRRNGKHWESENITEREQFGAYELHCDPAPLVGPGGIGLHVFARSYVGDLLHFQALRRWRVANRTEHKRAGARFRIDGEPHPVGLPWGGFCVVGRGREGSLVAYSGAPFRGIRAEEVPPPAGGVMAGDPAVTAIGPVVHAVARGRNGHILHFERTKGGWSAGDLVTLCEGAEPVQRRPVLIVHEETLHLFALTADARLLHLARGADGQWSARTAARDVEGDPAVTSGPAGLHVFAAGTAGGLVHAWQSAGAWRVENMVSSRAASRGSLSPAEGLSAWGSAEELRVFGRREGTLVQWVWRADSDWVGGAVVERAGVEERHEPGENPLLARDRSGGFHLFATNGRGTVLHLERGSWRASPGRVNSSEAVDPVQPVEPAVRAPQAGGERAEEADSFEATVAAPAPSKPPSSSKPAKPPKPAKPSETAAKEKGPVPKQVPVPPSVSLPELEGLETWGSVESPESAESPEEADPLADLPLLEPEASEELEPFEWEVTSESSEDPSDGPVELEPLNLEHMENWPKGPTRSQAESSGAEEAEDILPPWPEEA